MRTGAVGAEEVQLAARPALEALNRELNALAIALFSSALEHAADGPLAGGDTYTAPPPAGPYADELRRTPKPLRVACTTRAWSGVAVDSEVAGAVDRAAT